MLFKKENNIDKLSRQKKELVIKRDKLQRDMRNRNSNRETKIARLENASQTDYENTNKKVIKINREIEKVVRAIDSEQIYVNEVANSERKEHLQEQIQEKKLNIAKTTIKGAK